METFDKLKDLSGKDWLVLLPLVGTVTAAAYYTAQYFLPKEKKGGSVINPGIQKDSAKVVNTVDVEDIADKIVYCRCWRSKKFPLCDGSHNKHNQECGDNVGPLIVKHKEPAK